MRDAEAGERRGVERAEEMRRRGVLTHLQATRDEDEREVRKMKW